MESQLEVGSILLGSIAGTGCLFTFVYYVYRQYLYSRDRGTIYLDI